MTPEQIKERLSHHFVELIANRQGYKCSKPDPDHGVDLQVTKAVPIDRDGETRYLETGRYVQVQLKCTTEQSVIPTETGLKYDLEAKTYNDLVDRREMGHLTPLFLVLLVLPSDDGTWLTVSPNELVVRRAAYWYRPALGSTRTTNTSTIRIEIPASQQLTLAFFDDRFAEVYS